MIDVHSFFKRERKRPFSFLLFPLLFAGGGAFAGSSTESERAIAAQVRAAETAFAQTMADRDLAGFLTFVDDEAVFFGSTQVMRGVAAVAEGWTPYFDGPDAPFSWESEDVEVLASGNLALSSGPVLDAEGVLIGTFNSIWRRVPGGAWKVVFDKGSPVCGEE
jgi:ketosteroid isomerase-like protein